MDVSDVLPEEEPDMVYEWKHWHMDDQELESDDETEVGVWKKTKAGGGLQGACEGSDRSSDTVDGGWGKQGMKTRITRKNVAGRSRDRGSRGGGWFFDGRLEDRRELGRDAVGLDDGLLVYLTSALGVRNCGIGYWVVSESRMSKVSCLG